jgi:TP901 family phage tail tape measure protein
MADAQSVIELVFEGIDKTAAATQSVLSNVDKFSGNLEKATQPIADFTLGSAKIEAGILSAGAAVTAFSVNAAGQFTSSFNQISTLFDAGDEDVANFKKQIQDYAETSGKSFEDVTNSLAAAIGAGVDYRESLGLINVAEHLSIDTRSGLQGATEVLVSTLNAYGLSTKEAGAVSDKLFTVIKDGKIEMNDLSASLALVTPIAAGAGVSLDEVGAAVAALTAAGFTPGSAIEGLRAALNNIINPSAQARDLAQQLGIQFDAAALKSKGLAGVLADVEKATGGDAEKMGVLFGSIQGGTVATALAGKQFDAFKESLDHMATSAGAVEEQYGKMSSNIEVATQHVQNALQSMLISIGQPLLDEFGGVTDAISKIFLAIGDSAETGKVKELVSFIESQFQGLEATLQTVAKNLPAALNAADLSGFSDGLKAISSAVSGLFDGLDLTSVDGLKSAIELAGNGFNLLSNYVAGSIDSLKPFVEQVLKAVDGLDQIDPATARAAGSAGGFITQINYVSSAVNDAVPVLKGLVAIIGVNQGISLVSALSAATGGIGPLVLGLDSLAAAAGAGVAGFGIGTLINNLAEMATGTSISTFLTDTAIKFGLVDSKADELAKSLEQSTRPALEDIIVTAKRLDDTQIAPDASKLEEVTVSARMWGESVEEAAQRVEVAKAASEAWAKGVDVSTPLFDIATGKVIGFGDAAGRVVPAINSATDATKGFNAEAEKIKSAEVLEVIKAKSAENVAEIEADAKKTVAAFESINTTVKSTGDTISSLVGQLGNDKISKLDKLDIADQIKKESEIREKATEKQNDLIDAQIRALNARTDALIHGGALIQVDAPGLAPQLEAIWFEILKGLQTRVNADGLDMLLGAVA